MFVAMTKRQFVEFGKGLPSLIRSLDRRLQGQFSEGNGDFYSEIAEVLLVEYGRKGYCRAVIEFCRKPEFTNSFLGEFVNCRGLAGFLLTVGSGERIWVGF